jgi:hypothetical protein
MPYPDAGLPLCNPRALDELTSDTDIEFRQIALKQFVADLDEFCVALASAGSVERDRLIHSMASSAALMGAVRLSTFCLVTTDWEADALERLRELAQTTGALYTTLE